MFGFHCPGVVVVVLGVVGARAEFVGGYGESWFVTLAKGRLRLVAIGVRSDAVGLVFEETSVGDYCVKEDAEYHGP